MGPTKIYTENNFTHYTPKVNTVTSIPYYQVTFDRRLLGASTALTDQARQPLDRTSYFHTLERTTFEKQTAKVMCNV